METITIREIPYKHANGSDYGRIIAGTPIRDERRMSSKTGDSLFMANPGQISGHQGFLDYRIVDVPGEGITMYIARINVEPYCDARHVGKAMINAALVVAQDAGAKSIFAYVEDDNMEAQSFFHRNSFYRTNYEFGVEFTSPVPDKEVLPLEKMFASEGDCNSKKVSSSGNGNDNVRLRILQRINEFS